MTSGQTELQTERLHLRPWRDDDIEPFAAMNADPQVMAYFASTQSREASAAAVARWRARMDERGWGLWAAELRRTGEFIGFIGLESPAPALPCSPCVEVGWRLAAAHWGRGYATEGAKAALGIGFERLGLDEIVSFTAVGNRRSRAVMERLGMTETDPTFMHPALPVDSAVREHCLYRLSRARWLAMAPEAIKTDARRPPRTRTS
ncbi:MAG: GNAT family N-acetyltransferase [Caldimonas sp.]